jgi:hypothetical protein
MSAFDRDPLGEGLRAIGDEDEVGGGELPEDEGRDETERAEHGRDDGEPFH